MFIAHHPQFHNVPSNSAPSTPYPSHVMSNSAPATPYGPSPGQSGVTVLLLNQLTSGVINSTLVMMNARASSNLDSRLVINWIWSQMICGNGWVLHPFITCIFWQPTRWASDMHTTSRTWMVFKLIPYHLSVYIPSLLTPKPPHVCNDPSLLYYLVSSNSFLCTFTSIIRLIHSFTHSFPYLPDHLTSHHA